VVDPEAGTWQFAWDAAGRPVARRFPGDVRAELAYDARGFVASVEVWQGASRKDWLQYQGYDARGNPAAICEGAANCAAKTEVAYDALGRVTEVTYPGGASERFAYDPAGTRVGHTDRAGVERRYVHDAGGQLERIENAATGAVLESYEHDAAGRRTRRAVAAGPTTQYGYDPLGRLASVEQTGSAPFSLALAYDAAGHRRRRTDASGTARYLGEWLEERAGTRIRLVHAPGVDDVLAEVEDAATPVPRYLLADAAGNVVQMGKLAPSGAGTVETTRRYFAFGEVRSESSPFPPVERGFAGRPTEGASNLLYLRARHYDPRTGAFLQPDPLGIATDHAYAYASSNPFVYGDPWGLLSTANKAMNASLSGAGSITAEATRNLGTVNPSGAGTAAVSMGPGGALGTYTRLASAGNVATNAAFASEGGFVSLPDNAIDAVSQGAALLGGVGQIGTGLGLCSTLVGCLAGAPLIALGANNVLEGLSGQDAFLRNAAKTGAVELGLSERTGSIAFGVADAATSIGSLFRSVPKQGRLLLDSGFRTQPIRLFRSIPSDFERHFNQLTKLAIGRELVLTGVGIYDTFRDPGSSP
jgi:RHS repeat-associated protein